MPLFIAIALSLLAGAAVPLQAGSNARLGVVLGHPFWATVISLLISGLAIALVMLIVKVPRPNLAALLTGPWWIWLGGLAGVFYITVALISVPRLGALNFIMAVVVGQLISSLLIDYFGLLGLPRNTPSLQKLLGVSVVLAGFVIASRGWRRTHLPDQIPQPAMSRVFVETLMPDLHIIERRYRHGRRQCHQVVAE